MLLCLLWRRVLRHLGSLHAQVSITLFYHAMYQLQCATASAATATWARAIDRSHHARNASILTVTDVLQGLSQGDAAHLQYNRGSSRRLQQHLLGAAAGQVSCWVMCYRMPCVG
jgi:hypothetical protein